MGLRDGLKRRARGAARRVKRAIAGEPTGPSVVPAPPPPRVEAQPAARIAPQPAAPPPADEATSDEADPSPAEESSTLRSRLKLATTDETVDESEKLEVRERVIEALKTIFDPEIPVNIWELGLVYDVGVLDDRTVDIKMTLTSPNCPAAQSLPSEVQEKSAAVDGALSSTVDIVWDPPWTPDRMSEAAQLELNLI